MRTTEKDFEAAIAAWREWNEKINVVSRKDIDGIYMHHVLHSLCIARYMEVFHPGEPLAGAAVLDLGTGGGFPGIPLAFEWPEASVLLCDSIEKKVKVAAAVAEAAGLTNVRCVCARAESLPGGFDWVVTRAVAPLEKLYPWVRGKFTRGVLCLKGGDVLAEISDLTRRWGVEPAKIRVWKIEDWLKDEYFKEKFVIEVGKDYLCPPKSEN